MYRKYINIVEAANKGCPIATHDLEVNVKNRQTAIDKHHYGPANPDEPGSYWKDAAKQWNYANGTTISGGITVTGGYVTSTQNIDVKNALNFLNLGSDITYTDADKLVLAIKLLVDGTSDASLLATMNFIEAL